MHWPRLLEFLQLAWLANSLATLGAAVESNRAVREAAYGYRPDLRIEAEAGSPAPG